MANPELAGDGLGLELWLLLIREREAPEQPAAQREFQKRWAPEALPGRLGAQGSPPQVGSMGARAQ
eukprot:7854634-Alexandrium_andersonii.AAC.1